MSHPRIITKKPFYTKEFKDLIGFDEIYTHNNQEYLAKNLQVPDGATLGHDGYFDGTYLGKFIGTVIMKGVRTPIFTFPPFEMKCAFCNNYMNHTPNPYQTYKGNPICPECQDRAELIRFTTKYM